MMITHNALILTADGGRFCLYRNCGRGLAIELELLAEASRSGSKTTELGRDAPGRTFQSAGKRRSAYEQSDLHDREEEEFVAVAASQLSGYATPSTCDIFLIADPKTLGRLRAQLPDPFQDRIVAEINRDFAMSRPEEIVQLLRRLRPN